MSHFELDNQTYRFNYHRTRQNELSWKKGANFLAEFTINYPETYVRTFKETKEYKLENGGRTHACFH